MSAHASVRTQPMHGRIAPTPPAAALARLARQHTVLLTTYRRDGTPVGTPVHVAVDGDRAFVRTVDRAGKLKRIWHNPTVAIAPSTLRGTPTEPAIAARARILTGEEAMQAARALAGKYPILHGALIPWFHRLRGYRTMHIELRAAAPRTGPT